MDKTFDLDNLRKDELSRQQSEGSDKKLLGPEVTHPHSRIQTEKAEELNSLGVTNADLKRLVMCVFGIIFAFLIYGIVLEGMTKGKKISEIGLIFGLSSMYTMVARVILMINGEKPAKVPTLYFMAISFSYLGAMWCSTRALRFVNYPTQVLGKSCKAVPIVIVSTLMGKKYTTGQYLSILLIVAGVAVFNIYKAKTKAETTSTAFGLGLVVMSLGFDGLTGALEDKVIGKLGWGHGHGTFQLMYFINLWAVPLALGAVLIEQGGVASLPDTDMLMKVGGLGMAGALGQFFIFYTLSHFGAVACSIITTCRKVLTIMCSVIYYGHTLTGMQFVGLGVSFLGFGVNINEKKKAGKKKKKPSLELGVVSTDENAGKPQARV